MNLFKEYQKSLLYLVNNPLIRKEMEIPISSKILGITPNSVIYDGKQRFWTSNIFERKLFELLPELTSISKDLKVFANSRHLSYSQRAHFASFTSGAGDGYVGQTNPSWATVRNNTVGNDTDYISTTMRIIGEVSGGNYFIYRGFLPFDTSSLGAGASIASASLGINVTAVNTNGHNIYIVTATQASNTQLVDEDYDQLGTVAQSDNPLDGTSTGDKSQALNATGISNISLTGFTKLGLRSNADFNNSTPVDIRDTNIGTSENVTPGNRPTLTVTLGSGSSHFLSTGKYW